MRTNRLRPLLSATALAVAVVALGPTPASAKASKPLTVATTAKPTPPTSRVLPSDPSRPSAVVNSWALAPTGTNADGQPSTRPTLAYDLAPGAAVKDSVTLFNYSNVQLTFRVYATDAFNNVDGQFDLLTGNKTPIDAGSWVTLPQANITVPALAKADLPITITVPPDAGPGDHAAAVLAASQAEGTGPDGKIISLDRRTGSRLYVRVAGPLAPRLDVERIHTSYHPSLNPFSGTLDVAYTVRNKGNVRLAATQRLTVNAPFGIGLDRSTPVDVPELLPGNTVTLHARFSGIPAPVLLATTISLEPIPTKDGLNLKKAGTSRTGHTVAIPWTVLALMLVAGLLTYAKRAYRRHQGEGVATPAGAGQPDIAVVP